MATRHGISTTAITWEQEESEIEQDNTGKVTISVTGSVGVSGTPTDLVTAMALLPNLIPISNSGPIGNATELAGAKKDNQKARYLGDDTIQVTATYIIAFPSSIYSENGSDETTSESDKAQRVIATEDAPLLSHPIVQQFDQNDRRRLTALLAGDVRPNPQFDDAATDWKAYEFITEDPLKDDPVNVAFSGTDVTYDDITASPLDYARMLAAGVTTWRRPIIRHNLTKSRNDPATNSEYGKVGEAITGTPNLAPALSGDGQWFLNGITDTTDNGTAWTTQYDFERSGAGGVLKALYKGGTAEIA